MARRRGWHTFGEDTGMTPGILKIIADIADKSISTYRGRKALSRKYFVALGEAQIKRGDDLSPDLLKEIQETKDQLAAEAKGGTVERG